MLQYERFVSPTSNGSFQLIAITCWNQTICPCQSYKKNESYGYDFKLKSQWELNKKAV